MSIEHKSIDGILEVDLEALVENKVRERRKIEFKQKLPGNTDKDKKEFLYDASSFANAIGGDLIFGVREEDGVAVEIQGLADVNVDAELLRLENIARDGIAPRVVLHPGVVPLANGTSVIVLRIPRSWGAPHMVKYQNVSKFYSRGANGKYPLDVLDLRDAFLRSATIIEKIRDFRTARLGKIVSGETPLPIGEAPHVVLHIVPFTAFDAAASVALPDSEDQLRQSIGPLFHPGSWSGRFNFDGYATYTSVGPLAPTDSYLQLFRNGCIEAVENRLLRWKAQERLIPSESLEKALADGVAGYIQTLARFGAAPPFAVLVTLLGVSGYRMARERDSFFESRNAIERQDLMVPEVVIETMDFEPVQELRRVFDPLWNACGHARSLNYNDAG